MNPDPVAHVVLSLAIILVAAKCASHFAEWLGQSPVLGELVAGLVLGNLRLLGFSGLDYLKTDPSLDLLAGIGVILLLFEAGLGSTVGQMVKVGISAFLVATLGVTGSFVLGWVAAALFLPGASAYVHAYLGAALTATSVGISARVLKDLGRFQSNEARVILGAAVVDDVLGLVILAVATGTITAINRGVAPSYAGIGMPLAKASLFLIGALALGITLSPRLFMLASKLKTRGVLLAVGLAFCFLLSWLADVLGLAPIVGAFAAGLILEDLHYRDFVDRGEHDLKELVAPIASFLVPLFFALMGIRTDLRSLAKPEVLGLAIGLTLAAVLGKQLSCFGVRAKGINRMSVGTGMIPRGEVELIFANLGLTLTVAGERIVDQNIFSAIVAMVILTAIVTPPAMKWSFERTKSP